MYTPTHTHTHVQWNLSIMDTIGTDLIKVVSLFRGGLSLYLCHFRTFGTPESVIISEYTDYVIIGMLSSLLYRRVSLLLIRVALQCN